MRGPYVLLVGLAVLAGCHGPLPLPAPVTPESPADSALLRAGPVTARWQSSEAVSYELQVDTTGKFKKLVLDQVLSADSCPVALADGHYWWHVRPRSSDSIWGDWSPTRTFTLERFRVAAQVKTQGYPHDVAVRGNRAYVADGQAGLAIFDITSPEQPYFLASKMDSLNETWGVAVNDSYAYLAYGYTELLIVDVRRIDSLAIVGTLSYPSPSYGYDVAVEDSWVYIAAGAQFIKVDVAEPRYPNLVFQGYYPRGCHGVAVQGRYAYVALEQLGIASWLVDTVPPVQLGSMDSPSNARGIAVQGSYAYVADGRDGLVIADVTDPALLRQVGTLALKGYANSVAVEDTLAFVTCGAGGTSVVDVARPDAPSLVAVLPSNYACGVAVQGGYAFVGDRDAGLLVVKQEE